MKRASAFVFCCLLICMVASATAVHAGGFALYEWSNRGIAMGTTGYAIGQDASVIATNPALMTKLEGQYALAGAAVVSPQTSVYVNGNKNKTESRKFVIPHAYYTRQSESNENVWFGVGMFTRFGLGTYYDDNWIGKASLQHVDLESVSLNPNIAFKFTDDFSMAVGVEVLRGTIKLQRLIGANTYSADTEGYAVGGNIAFHYDIDDQWSAGLTYRAPMRMYTTGSGQAGASSTSGGQVVSSYLPGSITMAVGYEPTEDWNLEFDVIYTRWENTRELEYDGVITSASNTPLHYKNTYRFQLGSEYWAQDWLALRFGYVYDQTPTRAGDASFMLPANDRHLFSTGLGFKWDEWTADWAFMYVMTKERNNLSMTDPVLGALDVDFKNGQTWITGVSLGYHF